MVLSHRVQLSFFSNGSVRALMLILEEVQFSLVEDAGRPGQPMNSQISLKLRYFCPIHVLTFSKENNPKL